MKASKVKKVPSALKWLAETRARVAGQLQATSSSFELLCAHVDSLEKEFRAAVALKERTAANIRKLTSDLAHLDGSVTVFDATIEPEDIGVINGWQGRYGKRGALREYILEVLGLRAPDYVATPELAFHAIAEFGLTFNTCEDRTRWYQNSLRNALKALEKAERVERSADLLGTGSDARGWRPKLEQPGTLAALHAGARG